MNNTPAIILVRPQMGENIGASARAMLNCGLADLRLVKPRDGWPSAEAVAMSAGALEKMPPARVFETTAEAIADCHYILATTARPRDQIKTVFTGRGAGEELVKREASGQRTAILFGAERTGLTNEDVALAHGIVTIPVNPEFSSLNLGQTVLLLAYEFLCAKDATPASQLPMQGAVPSTHAEFNSFLTRLEAELDKNGFFRAADMKPVVIRNLRAMFSRAEMTEQEVRTFHGILSSLTGVYSDK
jgi:tRNA/rRNA methyltransferase